MICAILHVCSSPCYDTQGELEAELREEMRGYGIDPSADRLTSAQLSSAMAELERRRAVARADMTLADQQRHDYMRATVAWHVERVSGGKMQGTEWQATR